MKVSIKLLKIDNRQVNNKEEEEMVKDQTLPTEDVEELIEEEVEEVEEVAEVVIDQPLAEEEEVEEVEEED